MMDKVPKPNNEKPFKIVIFSFFLSIRLNNCGTNRAKAKNKTSFPP